MALAAPPSLPARTKPSHARPGRPREPVRPHRPTSPRRVRPGSSTDRYAPRSWGHHSEAPPGNAKRRLRRPGGLPASLYPGCSKSLDSIAEPSKGGKLKREQKLKSLLKQCGRYFDVIRSSPTRRRDLSRAYQDLDPRFTAVPHGERSGACLGVHSPTRRGRICCEMETASLA